MKIIVYKIYRVDNERTILDIKNIYYYNFDKIRIDKNITLNGYLHFLRLAINQQLNVDADIKTLDKILVDNFSSVIIH